MRKNFIVGAIVAAILVVVVVAVILVVTLRSKPEQTCYYCTGANQSKLGAICSPSPLGEYKQYAVSTDSNVCAPAGK